jgi:hypothetical protein
MRAIKSEQTNQQKIRKDSDRMFPVNKQLQLMKQKSASELENYTTEGHKALHIVDPQTDRYIRRRKQVLQPSHYFYSTSLHLIKQLGHETNYTLLHLFSSISGPSRPALSPPDPVLRPPLRPISW